MPDLKDICLVFDLDDTLYKEIDYVRSGIAAVLSQLDRLGFGAKNSRVLSEHELRSGRAIDVLMAKLNVPLAMHEALIWFTGCTTHTSDWMIRPKKLSIGPKRFVAVLQSLPMAVHSPSAKSFMHSALAIFPLSFLLRWVLPSLTNVHFWQCKSFGQARSMFMWQITLLKILARRAI